MKKIYYKPCEFAELLNVSVVTLQRWDREGKLTAHRTLTNRRYYTQQHYQEYLSKSSKVDTPRSQVGATPLKEAEQGFKLGIESNTQRPRYLETWQRNQHFLLLGSEEAGKFETLQFPLIIQDAQQSNRSIFYFDRKGHRADQVYVALKSNALYFNPLSLLCPRINLLAGEREIVVANFVDAFKYLTRTKDNFFKDSSLQTLEMGIKALKLVYGDMADLSDLLLLLDDERQGASRLMNALRGLSFETEEEYELKQEVLAFFENTYYAFVHQKNGATTFYSHAEMARDFLKKLLANSTIRTVLTLPEDEFSDVPMFSFEALLEQKTSFVYCDQSLYEQPADKHLRIGKMLTAYGIETSDIFTTLMMTRFYLAWRQHEDQSSNSETERQVLSVYLEEPFILAGALLEEQLTFGSAEKVIHHLSCSSLNALELEEHWASLVLKNGCCHKFIFPGISEKDWTVLANYYPAWDWPKVQQLPFPAVAYAWTGGEELESMSLELDLIDPLLDQALRKKRLRWYRERWNGPKIEEGAD